MTHLDSPWGYYKLTAEEWIYHIWITSIKVRGEDTDTVLLVQCETALSSTKTTWVLPCALHSDNLVSKQGGLHLLSVKSDCIKLDPKQTNKNTTAEHVCPLYTLLLKLVLVKCDCIKLYPKQTNKPKTAQNVLKSKYDRCTLLNKLELV